MNANNGTHTISDLRKDKSVSHTHYDGVENTARAKCKLYARSTAHSVTLVVEFEAWPVLRVVAVEVDDGQVGGAQQRRWELGTGKLPNKGRTVLGSGPHFQEVMVVLR